MKHFSLAINGMFINVTECYYCVVFSVELGCLQLSGTSEMSIYNLLKIYVCFSEVIKLQNAL